MTPTLPATLARIDARAKLSSMIFAYGNACAEHGVNSPVAETTRAEVKEAIIALVDAARREGGVRQEIQRLMDVMQ